MLATTGLMKELIIIVLAPVFLVTLVLGWLILLRKGRGHGRVSLSGLGINLTVETTSENINSHIISNGYQTPSSETEQGPHA